MTMASPSGTLHRLRRAASAYAAQTLARSALRVRVRRMVSWSMVMTAPRGWGGEGARVRGVGVARLPGIGESLVDESGAGESGGGVGERVGRAAVFGAYWKGQILFGRQSDLDEPGQCPGRAVDGQGVDRRDVHESTAHPGRLRIGGQQVQQAVEDVVAHEGPGKIGRAHV